MWGHGELLLLQQFSMQNLPHLKMFHRAASQTKPGATRAEWIAHLLNQIPPGWRRRWGLRGRRSLYP